MTNHWIDLKNADAFLIIGANPAENHPISMKWVQRAKEERGAKVIVVDPRVTRTCVAADYHAVHRPGTDIAVVNGIMKYAIDNNMYHHDYVANYTNASYLIREDFTFSDGEFAGIKEAGYKKAYDKSTWKYQLDGEDKPLRDETLQNPRCVFQLLKKHLERYDLDTVSQVSGVDRTILEEVAKVYTATGQPGKAGTVMYAMGITQHSVGTQNVRSLAMLQLLLGNIGIAGGGVNAMRGECNVQGSTDMAMLFHLIPGYMGVPREHLHPTLADYNKVETPASGYWSNKPKFLTSLLKAFYGDNATAENDFGYDYLPKCDAKDHSHQSIIYDTDKGIIKGMIAWGQNPVVGGPNQNHTIEALKKLDWLFVMDIFETETASFWKAPGVNPATIDTEVILLPAASVYEKEGSVTNSGRWIQWRSQAIEPIGDSKSDLWMVDRIFNAVKELYEKEGGAYPDPILKMNWDYDGSFTKKPDVKKVAFEINGYDVATGKGLASFGLLKDDGTTACGNWVYAGYFADIDNPNCKRRELEPAGGLGLHSKFSYSWPLNRRIVYNRCSADTQGKPWDPTRALFSYETDKWVNLDVPDFNATVAPEVSGKSPFIMTSEGVGRLFSDGPADGPFAEHYEPVESPVKNVFGKYDHIPMANIWHKDMEGLITKGDAKYPIIITTTRVCEHYQSGVMTRNLPALVELMPEVYVEISKELAAEYGIAVGDKVILGTPRGKVTVKTLITSRVKPMNILGDKYHVISMPWHWGFIGLSTGESANTLVPNVGDGNTSIPESKAFMCSIQKA